MTKIWVDADACPAVIREILFRAAVRTNTPLVMVANQSMQTPPTSLISSITVGTGFDMADHEIVRQVESGDLVITADIPLAADVIAKGALALSPRGELYTASNIRARLNIRDFMDTMRASGINSGGPPALNQRDRKQFADQLDTWLNRSSSRD